MKTLLQCMLCICVLAVTDPGLLLGQARARRQQEELVQGRVDAFWFLLRQKDLPTLEDLVDDSAVGFGLVSQTPAETKAEVIMGWYNYLEDHTLPDIRITSWRCQIESSVAIVSYQAQVVAVHQEVQTDQVWNCSENWNSSSDRNWYLTYQHCSFSPESLPVLMEEKIQTLLSNPKSAKKLKPFIDQ